MNATWKKQVEDGHVYYVEPSGRYRIQRHEVDDRWDTGALVPFSVQWITEERNGTLADGSPDWYPLDIYYRLRDAKAAAERSLA